MIPVLCVTTTTAFHVTLLHCIIDDLPVIVTIWYIVLLNISIYCVIDYKPSLIVFLWQWHCTPNWWPLCWPTLYMTIVTLQKAVMAQSIVYTVCGRPSLVIWYCYWWHSIVTLMCHLMYPILEEFFPEGCDALYTPCAITTAVIVLIVDEPLLTTVWLMMTFWYQYCYLLPYWWPIVSRPVCYYYCDRVVWHCCCYCETDYCILPIIYCI